MSVVYFQYALGCLFGPSLFAINVYLLACLYAHTHASNWSLFDNPKDQLLADMVPSEGLWEV